MLSATVPVDPLDVVAGELAPEAVTLDAAAEDPIVLDEGPTASFTVDPLPAACGDELTFDGSGSLPGSVDRTIVSYEWDFDYDIMQPAQFDVDATGEIVTHSYDLAGYYTAALRVTDDSVPAQTHLATFSIDLNRAPVADANGPYWITFGEETLVLDASGSFDPDEDCGDAIMLYEWDLGANGTPDFSGTNPVMDISPAELAAGLEVWRIEAGLPAVPHAPDSIPIALRVTDSIGLLQNVDTTELMLFDTSDDVVQLDGTVFIRGGESADTLSIEIGYEHKLTLDGVEMRFLYDEISEVVFNGGPGPDQVLFTGLKSTDETAKMWFDHAEFSRDSYMLPVTYSSVQLVQANMKEGAGDADQVYLYGTDLDAMDDLEEASPFHALLKTAEGVTLESYRHEMLVVDGLAGDADHAELYGGLEDDTFYTEPGWSFFTAFVVPDPQANGEAGGEVSDQGDILGEITYKVEVFGFPITEAHPADGEDTAIVHDSPADDGLLAYSKVPDGQVAPYSKVWVYDDQRDASNKPTGVYTYFRRMQNFDVVKSIADKGHESLGDVARIHDAPGHDDTLTASPTEAVLEHMEDDGLKSVTAVGYGTVLAYAGPGDDTDKAFFSDTPGVDGVDVYADKNFVNLYSPPAGYPGPNGKTLYDVFLRAKGFDYTEVTSNSDDDGDMARFYDSSHQDHFTAEPGVAEMTSNGIGYKVNAFEYVRAYSLSSHVDNDTATLSDSIYADELTAALTSDPLDRDRWAKIVLNAPSLDPDPNAPVDHYFFIQGFSHADASYHASDGDDISTIDQGMVDWLGLNPL